MDLKIILKIRILYHGLKRIRKIQQYAHFRFKINGDFYPLQNTQYLRQINHHKNCHHISSMY